MTKPIRYCMTCGKQMIVAKSKTQTIYDSITGKKKIFSKYELKCVNERWWNWHSRHVTDWIDESYEK